LYKPFSNGWFLIVLPTLYDSPGGPIPLSHLKRFDPRPDQAARGFVSLVDRDHQRRDRSEKNQGCQKPREGRKIEVRDENSWMTAFHLRIVRDISVQDRLIVGY
jgi:hypothetical protein